MGDEEEGGSQREINRWFELQPHGISPPTARASAARLGSVWVRAQLDLQRPDVCSSMTRQELEDELECRVTMHAMTEGAGEGVSKSGLPSLAALSQARETGKVVLNTLAHTLDTIEMVKNALNWTHPHKSRYIFNLLAAITMASALVAARYIILVVGVMEFSFHFWPDWYKEMRTPLVDRIANMVSSV